MATPSRALMLKTSKKTATTFVTFFNFSLRLAAISERFELESSDWAHFLRLFKLKLKNKQAP
jgi:hypothetical protein